MGYPVAMVYLLKDIPQAAVSHHKSICVEDLQVVDGTSPLQTV